jgi:hypothetical protein
LAPAQRTPRRPGSPRFAVAIIEQAFYVVKRFFAPCPCSWPAATPPPRCTSDQPVILPPRERRGCAEAWTTSQADG